MKYLEDLKKKMERELEDLSRKDLSMASLEKIHVLTDSIKNIDKICMLEEEVGFDGYSEARGGRGRGRNARRDSMGRYSSYAGYSDGYSEDDMSYRGGDSSYRSGYSMDDAKNSMMHRLGEMMRDADPKTRKALEKCMMELEG